jgi:hypothetical protein
MLHEVIQGTQAAKFDMCKVGGLKDPESRGL